MFSVCMSQWLTESFIKLSGDMLDVCFASVASLFSKNTLFGRIA